MAPLVASPARRAGLDDIHRATSARLKPRSLAWVQTTGNPSWIEEIPPQAVPKSPLRGSFSSGGHGEWSDTTQSIAPDSSPAQRRSRFVTSLIGGQHLNSVLPGPTCSAVRVR